MFQLLQSLGIAGLLLIILIPFISDRTSETFESEEIRNISPALATAPTLPPKLEEPPTFQPQAAAPPQEPEIQPMQLEINPPPVIPSQVQEFSWDALVNIFCTPKQGAQRLISGSGVLIDPRGVILTNAHVAQFLLLGGEPDVNLTCMIRTGSPATGAWKADILYIPSPWVQKHAEDIKKKNVLGTGEFDYALLVITGSYDNTPLPAAFPYVPFNTEENHRAGDLALLAAYPAEFAGEEATEKALKASSSITTIQQILTFYANTIDVVSLGGVPVAQSGSSGGAVLNQKGQLTGIISTTSEGATTAERNLRAITLPYINRSIRETAGFDLAQLLSGNVTLQAQLFMETQAPELAGLILQHFKN